MNRSPVHLFHIAYSQQTLGMLQPGFKMLDNLANPRPDWYESWPIRSFLMHQPLEEDAYYGFFSPKFFLKTGLDANTLKSTIAASDPDTQAYFVCPQAEVGAVFINPVHGSEFTDPGAMATVQAVLDQAGFGLDVASQVIDSTHLVYSNYVIAKPAYWRRWLSLVETVYEIAEYQTGSTLQAELTHPTRYDGGVQRKVFLIECLASLIFIRDQMKIQSIPVNDKLSAQGVLYPYREQALVCDALKIAYNTTRDPRYMQSFEETSAKVLARFIPSNAIEKIVLVVATRLSEEEFHIHSATGKSLKLFNHPGIELKLFAENSRGLPALYNSVIDEYLAQNVLLVFAHDDLHFMDWFWPEHLAQALDKYAVVGIVGNRMRHPMQPSWAFLDHLGTWDKKENLSGSIAHGNQFPPDTFADFGPTGEVKLLDGVLLAMSSATVRQSGLRFDEQFNFHFYDLDLCRSAEQLNLKLGTAAVALMHESKGSFNNQSWLDGYKAYISKWGE